MIRIDFSEEEIQQLNYERYHHPHPRVQKKMEVVYLKSQGLSHQEIRRLCQISKTTLVRYLRQYQVVCSRSVEFSIFILVYCLHLTLLEILRIN